MAKRVADGNFRLRYRLRLQDRRAGRGPAFQVGMGLGGVLQCVGVVDRDVQLAADDGGKQRVGAFQQFRALADIVVELRPGREQRAVVVKFGDREWRYRAGGVAEADKQAARLQAGQRARKGSLADAVIDDVATLVAADLFDA